MRTNLGYLSLGLHYRHCVYSWDSSALKCGGKLDRFPELWSAAIVEKESKDNIIYGLIDPKLEGSKGVQRLGRVEARSISGVIYILYTVQSSS